jgi:predicted DNA-binding transcriptional regulator YafY
MRASRLLSMLILLQLRGRQSATVLAREFEVSVRTVYRDIDHLSAAGVPIYAARGRHGGVALLEGWRTRLTGFTAAEAEALALTGAAAAAADLGLSDAAAAAQLKLLASLPADAGASAARIAERFHLDPVRWYGRAAPADLLATLAPLVWSGRRLRVRYESWKDVVERDVDALGLVLKAGDWYLVAAVDGQPRTYRVGAIQGLEALAQAARRPPGFDLGRYWAAWTRDFEARLIVGSARVRLSPAGLRLLRDVSPAAADAVDSACADADGWRTAAIPVETPAVAARQLLRLGAEIEVLSPPALRSAIAREAAAVTKLYGDQVG